MRAVMCLAAFAALAFSVPAEAQPRTRDHRSSSDAAPERERETVRARRGGSADKDEGKVKRRDRREAREDRRDRRDRREAREDRRDRRDAREDRRDRRDAREDRRDRRDAREDRRDRRDAREDGPRRRDHRRSRRYFRGPVVSGYAPAAGPGGTEVTIRGRHFGDETRVYVGGEEVRRPSVSPSRITFKIPRRAEGELGISVRAGEVGDDIFVGNFEVRERTRARAERGKRRAERERRARQRWHERRGSLPDKAEERRKRYEEEREKMRRTREERRRARAARLRAQWEREFLARPQVVAELALHAERKARLERMLRLAEIDDRERLIIRIEILMEREDERHEGRMASLRAQLR